jgi:catechol 2,3-dioxygenase-like lactoylglutathione lyase family enzyme
MNLDLVSIIVDDYDAAILWFTNVLGFALVEDVPSLTNDGRAKRWVVVRPPGARTGVLLARADGDGQRAAIGAQFAGRVGLFLRVEDFEGTLARLREAKAEIVTVPRDEAYGRVVVFQDLCGNKWDLLGPAPQR